VSKRVNDMASEFGISADEVMNLLRSMDVPVRSQTSPLSDEQVARVRARWEREKRARAEKPAPPARRRKSASATSPAAASSPATSSTTASAPASTESTASNGSGAQPSAPAAAAATSAGSGAGVRRRRAADIVPPPAPEPLAPAPVAPEIAAAAPTPSAPATPGATPTGPRPSAPSPFRPLPVEEAAPPRRDAEHRETEERRPPAPQTTYPPVAPEPMRPAASAPGGAADPGSRPAGPQSGSFDPNRPRPVIPGAPRNMRPAASSGTPYSSSGNNPPRPVASAAPGAGAGAAPPRRDDKRPMSPGPGMGGGQMAGGRRKKGKRGAVDQEAVSANITRTMSAMRTGPGRRTVRRPFDGVSREELEAERQAEVEREKKTVRVNEFITVSELAEILKLPSSQIVGFALKNLGMMVTVNQRLDFDQIELIAGEYGFQAVREQEYAATDDTTEEVEDASQLAPRPPVVTIMGHVDHGKTSLLDYIRKANVVAGEAGGITQHIGAYHVSLPKGKSITFLDTPGHEAFTAMRARGAQVTDIVVLVVAADDQVMPQTIEAISHAKNAGVPMIVAINKIDLPAANVMKVKQDLLQQGVVLEEFGGTTLATAISAKKGTNVDELLDQILLQAEILDLKADPNRRAKGAVIEAQLDPGKGPVATVLIENGTLHVGDDFICGMYSGRVRALLDERNKPVKAAGPAIPVQVLGIEKVPSAGDILVVVEDATDARETAQRRERLDREARNRRTSARAGVTLEEFMAQTAAGERRSLRIVIKADQGGPAEALADALAQLSTSEVEVQVIHRGVGAVSESDVLLAKASGAIIVGFHVRPDNNARATAEREGVEIKLYRIIYEAVADVRSALEGMLRPEQREVIDGDAEVRQLFKVAKIGVIAGCSVRTGVITREGRVRVVRDGKQVYDGRLASLRRFKDDVREVRAGFECGIGIENYNDLKVGDVIEAYRTEEHARTLTAAS
jgi:translation initiation factor IF-2